eukprot:4549025-Amphidinium_carterae.1
MPLRDTLGKDPCSKDVVLVVCRDTIVELAQPLPNRSKERTGPYSQSSDPHLVEIVPPQLVCPAAPVFHRDCPATPSIVTTDLVSFGWSG